MAVKIGSETFWSEWFAWVPVLLFVLAVITFYWWDIGISFESQALLITFSVLFSSSVSFFIMYLAARSYLTTGSRAVLLLGCGALLFAIINVMGGILMDSPNLATTIYNTGAFLAGLCYVGSAFLAYTQKPQLKELTGTSSHLGHAYIGVLIVMGLLILGTIAGVTPAFFVPGQGSTLLRQVLLNATVIEFVIASVCLYLLYRSSRTPFLAWYSLGLLLIGLGIWTLSLSNSIWTPLTWVARGGQYLGGLYLLIAIWNISENGGDWRIPLERALRESEEKYKQIVETAGEGIWVLDNNAITVSVNTRMADMLGYSVEELIGKNAYDLVYKEDVEKGKQIAEKAIKDIREKVEFRYRKKDGSPLWAIVSSEQLFDSNGKHTGSFAMFTDITERKRAEEVLRESEARFRSVLDNSIDVIYCMNLQTGRFEYISPSAEAVVGYSPEELQAQNGEKALAMIHPDDLHAMQAALTRVDDTGECEVEYRQLTKKGDYRWISNHMSHTMDSNGRALYRNGNIRDITERKQAEAALRESEMRLSQTQKKLIEKMNIDLDRRTTELRTLLDLLPISACMTEDRESKTMYANPIFEDLLGIRRDSNMSMSAPDDEKPSFRSFLNGVELSPDELPIQQAIATGVIVHDADFDIVRSDGRIVNFHGHAAPLYDEEGNVRGAIGAFEDVTQNKHMTEELVKARDELELRVSERTEELTKANESLVEAKQQAELYIDLMAHDISNMHHIAMGQLEMAQETMDEKGMLKAEDGEFIETSYETLKRSAHLIENVRKLQKIKSGDYREERINLNGLLSDIVREYDSMVPANSIKYVDNGPIYINSNRLLHDVFTNLVGNAIKHSNGNGINISIKLEKVSENGKNNYKVSVEDNGTGIPDDMKDRIFNRLQRGETKARGLGLGLYIVKSLVDSCHGKVWVEDRIKGDHTKGSRFVVILPAVDH